MEALNKKVTKTHAQFKRNYDLHDKAVAIAKPQLEALGFGFRTFGEDKRNERVWEAGEDKPDSFILYENKTVGLIDWKGKEKRVFWLNKRAYDSYIQWGKKLNLHVYVIFVVVETKEIKVAELPAKEFEVSNVWDKNEVIKLKESELISLDEFKQKIKGHQKL